MGENPLTAGELTQFTGTERWFRHGLVPTVTYTEGVQHLAERAGAYWLIDEIAIANSPAVGLAKVRAEEFQVWRLRRGDGNSATLSVEDGNGNEVWRKTIEFTDFPLPEIAIWFTDNVILLPSEY